MTTVKEADYITLNDTEEEKLRRMLIAQERFLKYMVLQD